ncbi:MAG TPA: hypothetical protein VKZ53_08890 [Candidatus Angelobacter sp.]|nr:hypothetical protein [Candidatus Angelobacter sp.]
MKSRIAMLLLALSLSLGAIPASAQLGSGIVFDPSNYKNALLRYLQLQQQLRQLQMSYSLFLQQYQFLQTQAQQIQNMPARYRAAFSDWHQLLSQNTFGNTGQWTNGVNTGNLSNINAGYSQIVGPLRRYDSANLSASLNGSLQTQQGMLELLDAANVESLRTIGEIRNSSQQIAAMLGRLENDSLSPDNQLNGQVAVLNKINAASVVLARSMQDTNKLLVGMLEQATGSAAHERKQQGEDMNVNIRAQAIMQQTFAAIDSQPSSGPFRLP